MTLTHGTQWRERGRRLEEEAAARLRWERWVTEFARAVGRAWAGKVDAAIIGEG